MGAFRWGDFSKGEKARHFGGRDWLALRCCLSGARRQIVKSVFSLFLLASEEFSVKVNMTHFKG